MEKEKVRFSINMSSTLLDLDILALIKEKIHRVIEEYGDPGYILMRFDYYTALKYQLQNKTKDSIQYPDEVMSLKVIICEMDMTDGIRIVEKHNERNWIKLAEKQPETLRNGVSFQEYLREETEKLFKRKTRNKGE